MKIELVMRLIGTPQNRFTKVATLYQETGMNISHMIQDLDSLEVRSFDIIYSF